MSVLLIGGDRINSIKSILENLGAKRIRHLDSRKKCTIRKKLPKDVGCVVMLTNYLSHNTMSYFKKEAKKGNIPMVFSKHSESHVYSGFEKVMRENKNV